MFLVINIAGTLSVLLWVWVCQLSHGISWAPGDLGNGFHHEIDNDEMPTEAFLALHGLLCLILTFVLLKIRWIKSSGILRMAIGYAVIFRLVLLPSVPIHESDFYRYLWDGKVAAAGINPYRFEPGAVILHEKGVTGRFEDPGVDGVFWEGREFSESEVAELERLAALRDENPEWYARIGHPAIPTIYPPLAQAVFSVSSLLFGDSLIGLKCLLLAFDLGVIGLIVAILRRLGKNPFWVLAYAWNPLVLKEFANSAHYDAVPVFFTVMAVWLVIGARSRILVSLALAGGVLAKFFSALLLPLLIFPRPRNALPYLIFGGVVAAGFLPFVWWGGIGFSRPFDGLGIYNARWHYNGGCFTPLYFLLARIEMAKAICAGLLVAAVLMVSWRSRAHRDDSMLVHGAFVIMAAFFVLNPSAFPWYYTWVLPFVCLFPSVAWIGLSFLLPINYLDFHSAEDLPLAHASWWGLPVLWWLVWTTFSVLLAGDWWWKRKPVHLRRPTTTR